MKKHKDFYGEFELDYKIVDEAGFNPYYPIIQSGLSESVIINNDEYIDLASNNYLGFANHPRLKEASKSAIDKYGVSLCATPIASGYSDLYNNLELKISNFLGLEDCLIFPSCYQANNGLFPVIAGKDDIAIIDRGSHSSLIEGVKSSACKIWPYLHNNLNSLEDILKKTTTYRYSFVITESVFSTEGDIAPVKEIIELCNKYNSILIIDDSHGIGVIGKTGKGILEYAGINNFDGIYTASLGKSLANAGGVICGKSKLINYFRYYSSHLVYSTSVTPPTLAGVSAAINLLKSEFSYLSEKMWSGKKRVMVALKESGFDLTDSISPIISIKSGNSGSTLSMAKEFYQKRVLTTPFIYPSVQLNEGRIRLIVGAKHSESTLNRLLEIINEMKR